MNVTHGLRRALQINAGRSRHACSAIGSAPGRRSAIASRASPARCAAMGVGAGDRVAVLMLNQDRYLELYLAVAWAGAVIVPVNIRWSAPEIEDSLRDCRPMVLVVDDAFAAIGGRIARAWDRCGCVHADDGATPAGAASYEALLQAASPVPDAMRGAERPRRHLLHRRHHRALQGRDAEPRQPDGATRSTCWPRGCSRRHDLSARGADVPPGERLRRCTSLMLSGGTQRA